MKKESLIKRYIPYMCKKVIYLRLSLVVSFISSIFKIAIPYTVWLIIKKVLNSNSFDFVHIKIHLILLLCFTLLATILYFVSGILSHIAAFSAEINIQKKSTSKLLKMPLGFFENNESGRIRKIINESASDTHTFIAHQLPDQMSSILIPFILVGAIIFVDYRLGLTLLVPFLISAIILATLMNKESKKFMAYYYNSLENLSSQTTEYIRGMPVIKTYNSTVFTFNKYLKDILNYKKWSLKYTMLWRTPYSAVQVFINGAILFVLPIAILLIFQGYNIKTVLTNYIFYLLISPIFSSWIIKVMYAKNDREIAKKVLDKLDGLIPNNIIKNNNKWKKIGSNDFKIVFDNVSFKYPNSDNYALENVSFVINRGEKIAFVGPSGSGKSTIIKLLARFYDYTGSIYIDGTEIRDISQSELMTKLSFIFQQNNFFRDSLKNNLTLYQDYADDEIWLALKASKADTIINSLPKGLDTIYKEDGYLSGGEIQRLALARCYLKNSDYLILDEATAFADPENESLIYDGIYNLASNKTTIFIMHRFKNMDKLNMIYVLDNGKITESGNHNNLIKQQGLYNKLFSEYQKSIKWTVNSEKSYK